MFSTRQRIAVRSQDQRKRVISSVQSGSNFSSSANVSVSSPGMSNQKDTLLSGILPSTDDAMLRGYYRDIYDFDHVSGAAVDLLSSLPFSDWTLVGADDRQLAVFNSAMDRLNFRSLLPELSIDYLVLGVFIATLVYKREAKQFTDIIPHNPDDIIQSTLSPIYSADPHLQLRVNKSLKDLATGQDAYNAALRARLNDSMVASLKHSLVTLDPLTTLYLPRKTYSVSGGTSFYRRILPIFLLERLLYRGTLTEATRRQRSILHITAGDEFWEPTEEELLGLVTLFQQADLDPIGAMIATRNDVQTAELRAGGEFWRYTDIVESTTVMKLRAMGISESFLSGEANYNTAEVALSVFIEGLRAYRLNLTRRLFTNKLFPLISVINGFYKQQDKVESTVNPYLATAAAQEQSLTQDIQFEMNDTSKLVIPEVHWHKQLKPQADRDYMELLTMLEEKGVPITLRMWAAAGGLAMDNIKDDLPEDIKLKKEIKDLMGKSGVKPKENEDEEEEYALSSVMGKKPRSIISRDYGEQAEIIGRTKTGRPKSVNQRRANERANVSIAKAMQNLSDEEHLAQVLSTTSRKIRL